LNSLLFRLVAGLVVLSGEGGFAGDAEDSPGVAAVGDDDVLVRDERTHSSRTGLVLSRCNLRNLPQFLVELEEAAEDPLLDAVHHLVLREAVFLLQAASELV